MLTDKKKTVWVEVTQDKYQFIKRMEDTPGWLANRCGVSKSYVEQQDRDYRHGRIEHPRFMRIELEEEDDELCTECTTD